MNEDLYVGLMSGTSLDGADAVLADFSGLRPRVLARSHHAFDADLHDALAALAQPGANEIDCAATVGNRLALVYAAAVEAALRTAGVAAASIRAIGCHGQTIRHRPDRAYTVQIGNAALLAESAGIAVVADFRSRDMAAGGQGAPLAPAFHAAVFASAAESRAVLNLGGIANLTRLAPGTSVIGFDCGPGNGLLDAWASRHLGARYDDAGRWAAGGLADGTLLARMLDEPYFRAMVPKSTGRELFNVDWLARQLAGNEAPQDVQATLLALTARSVSDAMRRWCGGASRLIVCGGGTKNIALMKCLAAEMPSVIVESSAAQGVEPEDVEALAFAWLARATLAGAPGNLASVTGARGPRVLGAIYPR